MSNAFQIQCERPWLVVRFSSTQRIVSWSLNRPGLVDASTVAWLEVRDSDFLADRDPAEWFRQRLGDACLADAVGMMTARNVASFVHGSTKVGNIEAHCIVTVGLNNGERIGKRADVKRPAPVTGTINILCHVSRALTDAALLEAASIVAQARTVTLVEADFRRPGSADIVTGTGTDCIVMAAPIDPQPDSYAGMHTDVGEAVGACVLSATKVAAKAWIAERGGLASA